LSKTKCFAKVLFGNIISAGSLLQATGAAFAKICSLIRVSCELVCYATGSARTHTDVTVKCVDRPYKRRKLNTNLLG